MNEEYVRVLSMSLVFQGMSYGDIEDHLLNQLFQYREYEKGELIAQSDSECTLARIVLKGRISAEMIDLSGKVLRIEDILPSGMIAPAFLYGTDPRYPVNVVAAVDSIIWQMQKSDFLRFLQKDLRMLQNFLNAVSDRTQFLTEKIRFLSFPSIRAKLSGLMLRYSEGKDVFTMPFTHRELSELFGVARPSLSREIGLMNSEGAIKSERNEIHILSKQLLLEWSKE